MSKQLLHSVSGPLNHDAIIRQFNVVTIIGYFDVTDAHKIPNLLCDCCLKLFDVIQLWLVDCYDLFDRNVKLICVSGSYGLLCAIFCGS